MRQQSISFFQARLRLALLLAGCGLSAAAALAVSSSASAAASSAGLPGCQTAGLVVWLDTNGNGAAGSVYYILEFSNLSGHTCTLRGYPGVSAIGLRGQQLGRAAVRDNLRKVRTITLKNGASAVSSLRIVEAGNFDPPQCRQTTAAGLRVFVPGQRAAKTVPYPFAACTRSGPSFLGVQAVRAA